jgi:hypothetical protein
MIRVTVDGCGSFQIEQDRIPELLAFLSKLQSVRVNGPVVGIREVQNNEFTGRELING